MGHAPLNLETVSRVSPQFSSGQRSALLKDGAANVDERGPVSSDTLRTGMSTAFGDSDLIPRPSLERLLAAANDRRLTALVADAGFGKTTTMSQAFDAGRTVWHTITPVDQSVSALGRSIIDNLRLMVPAMSGDVLLAVAGGRGPDSGSGTSRPEALAAAIAQDLSEHLRRHIVFVIDDAHELDGAPESSRFLAALSRHAPPMLHLVVASRSELPFPTARMQLAKEADEITAEHLAFTVEEVGELARKRMDRVDRDLIEAIHERTAGWPVAVVYAIEAARAGGTVDLDAALRGETLFRYLAEEVLDKIPSGLIAALRSAAELPWIDPDLLDHLGKADNHQRTLDQPLPHLLTGVPELSRARAVAPLVREFLKDRYELSDDERRSVLQRAAEWYEAGGFLSEALACRLGVDDPDTTMEFLVSNGAEMISRGMAQEMVTALAAVGEDVTPEVLLLGAEATQLLGDWEKAMSMYRHLIPGAGEMPARIAWRLGFLHHMRGDVSSALETYRLGKVDSDSPADGASLYAWMASAHWLRGERTEAERLATEALKLAQEANAPASLATAHTVLAMVAALNGDRAANDTHYLRALEHAERARDVVQTIRIRSNRSSHFLEEGDFDSALAELDIALRLADMSGFELWRGMALSNRGQVVSMLGSLEEAISDLTQSREVFRRIGSNFEAYPLAHLGDVYALRGDTALSRACFEEAVSVADETDLQALVPALSGLARLIARDDIATARALAKRATEVDSVIGRVRALVTSGWVEFESGDLDLAARLAAEAAKVARIRRDLPGLAESLELQARCAGAGARIELLEQARAVWREIGAPVGVARIDVAIAAEVGGSDGMALARAAATTLGRLGAKGLALEAAQIAERLAKPAMEGVRIHTLGGFGVSIAGSQVPLSAWQSKVARDLLGMLVAARGRPTHREVLLERLWPGDDPSKASNRLSVALTTIRNVLDPDREHDANRFVQADRDSVALNMDELHIDVDVFLETATQGMKLMPGAERDRGLVILESAEAMYLGDFLEEHPYEDWSVGLREEAKALYVNIASVLAEADFEADDFDGAARRYRRILERDPFNEPAHLSLVRAMVRSGRHGASRRLYGIYVSRMGELDVEPEAFPA
jgi:ATP/maltotriose-dependent transcriptional regulator MalT/DNA-binding SARP family transcriptional activator